MPRRKVILKKEDIKKSDKIIKKNIGIYAYNIWYDE
jgi:hypothetical protein